MCGMYIINGVHGPEPRSSWGNTSSNYYNDVTMGTMASQITSLTIVYLIVYSDAEQRKHQSSASLAFVRGLSRWISRTNGQLRGKCFHLMTSSWPTPLIYDFSGASQERKNWEMYDMNLQKNRRYNKSQTKPCAYFVGYTTWQTRFNFNPSMDK